MWGQVTNMTFRWPDDDCGKRNVMKTEPGDIYIV
jgi:hypothetical protein